MALRSAAVTVGTAAVAVTSEEGDREGGQRVTVHNPSATTAIHVGGPAVTTATGIPIAVGTTRDFVLHSGERLYAISSMAGQTLRVLQAGA